jgi:DNA-binding NtrC family response regulator
MIAIKYGTRLRDVERAVILGTLAMKKGNRTHTAQTLGIGIRTLQRKLNLYKAQGLMDEANINQPDGTVQ